MPNSTKKKPQSTTLRIPNIRTCGDHEDLKRRVWQVIQMCWTVIRSEKTTLEEKRQFGHLLSQIAGTYTKLLEQDLREEFEEMKEDITSLKREVGLKRVA